jgi:ERCC4-related helicase
MKSFEVGDLVYWSGTDYGVVTSAAATRVTVHVDGATDPMIFATEAGVVRQVDLGDYPMLLRRSTGEVGANQGPAAAGSKAWRVFMGGQMLVIQQSDLRPYVPQDAVARIERGTLGLPKQFVMTVAARARLVDHHRSELMSIAETRVEPMPHQVSVVHRVVSDFPHRFLLCDEVGLGKTIEAGMVLKELRARGAAKRTIIIVPPNLVGQWQFELKTKFNEPFAVLNAATVKHLQNAQGQVANPFEAYESVIVSAAWVAHPKWAALAAATEWDMVVVDEAHHARVRITGKKREETRLYKAVRRLVAPDVFSQRAALLLTATPMQLNSSELYSLVELLDPALFPTEEHFKNHRDQLPGLNRMVQNLQTHGFPIPGQSKSEVINLVAHWLQIDVGEATERLTGGQHSLSSVCAELSSKHLLSEVLIRNRKSVVGGFMPRNAVRWKVKLTLKEQLALESVEAYVRDGFALAEANNDRAYGFLMTTFQKIMASSNRALRTSLYRRQQRLLELAENPKLTKAAAAEIELAEASIDNDELVADALAEISAAHDQEAEILERLVAQIDSLKVDSKGNKLVKKMSKLKEKEPDVKVLLFTQFRETQNYIAERLEAEGWDVHVFHGQLKPEAKDQSVEAFKTSKKATVLISTEAGGEGRNFQFCHFLVNYDLPWNPMKLEQRIGRLDRIGQEHVVNIINLSTQGTVEERVLDVLEHRIKLFEATVGGLDPILGEAEKSITKILQMAENKRDAALVRFEDQIGRDVSSAREAEEKMRDLILEVRSFDSEGSAGLLETQTEMDAATNQRLMIRLLTEEKTHLDERPDGTFVVRFNGDFRAQFPDIADGALRKRQISFRPELHLDSQHIEYFTLGHPVADAMLTRAINAEHAGCAAAITLDSTELIPAGEGWLVVHLASVSGVRPVEVLVGAWVDSAGLDQDRGRAILDYLTTMPSAQALPPEDVPSAEVVAAVDLAELKALDVLQGLTESVGKSASKTTERNLLKLSAYFDVREAAAAERLAHARGVVESLQLQTDSSRRKILPVWEANVQRAKELCEELEFERVRRLAELERQRFANGEVALVAVGRVRVVEVSADDSGSQPE